MTNLLIPPLWGGEPRSGGGGIPVHELNRTDGINPLQASSALPHAGGEHPLTASPALPHYGSEQKTVQKWTVKSQSCKY